MGQIIPLREALITSVNHPDEVDLAGEIMRCGGELLGAGETVRQLALLGDEPSIHQLADVILICHATARAVGAYAVARGLRLQGYAVDLPCDCEPR